MTRFILVTSHLNRLFITTLMGSFPLTSKFKDAKKARGKNSKKAGSVDKGLSYIKSLYSIEIRAKKIGISGQELLQLRRDKAKPILDEMYKWLEKKSFQVVPKSLLGRAISYTLNQWHRLIGYIDSEYATPDNNLAENAIRPFCVGRKNWLFAGNPKGAQASATIYSLLESAKANKLEPYKYLRYLFENLPTAEKEEDYRKLLPSSLAVAELETASGVSRVKF